MSQIMRRRNVCPQCGTTVHVKQLCCACGHAFTLKRKALLTADNQKELVKQRRTMESVEETLQRQEQARTHRASMRASETQEQALQRQEPRVCTPVVFNIVGITSINIHHFVEPSYYDYAFTETNNNNNEKH